MKLQDSKYLYYTNKSTDKKIIVNISVNQNSYIPLNPGKGNDSIYSSFPFYEEIDSDSIHGYLYSINYLGINSSSISKNEISKLKNFKQKIEDYIDLSIAKIIFFCFEILYYIFFILIFLDIYFQYNFSKIDEFNLFGLKFPHWFLISLIPFFYLNW